MYLIVDMNSDYKELMNYKDLKNLLIDTVKNDLLMNCAEYDIAKDCSDMLEKMAREDYTNESWIINQLESYCYKTIDLLDLQRDLEDAKEYFNDNNKVLTKEETNNVFDKVLEVINKGVE